MNFSSRKHTNNMKQKLSLTLITTLLLAAGALAQPSPPPAAPVPPAPPAPPAPGQHDHDKLPKVPVTFLGVETSDVPRVVSEQLGLAKGFGLVVDYIVPNGPAAGAGLQQNDIIKLLNDQILVDPDQLSKLIRSFPDGTTVTLTVLRKGQEQKIPVKLGKKEVPQRRGGHGPGEFNMGEMDFGDMGEQMEHWKEQMSQNKDMVREMVMKAREQAERAREQAQQATEQAREQAQQAREQAREEAQRAREEGQRAREEALRVRDESNRNGKINITSSKDGAWHNTQIDLAKAQIVFSDDKGELRLDHNDGKKILTAKDPQGRLLFSGPVETSDDLAKVPADVRDRYNKLEQKDLPSVAAPEKEGEDQVEPDSDEDDDDSGSLEQVSNPPVEPNQTVDDVFRL
jgi:serine protease Do